MNFERLDCWILEYVFYYKTINNNKKNLQFETHFELTHSPVIRAVWAADFILWVGVAAFAYG